MENAVDWLSLAVRAASFIALLQAAGAALFIMIFNGRLRASRQLMIRTARSSALLTIGLVLTHHLLEAARMAGELSGVLDASLQRLAMTSPNGVANISRMLAASLLAIGVGPRRVRLTPTLLGVVLSVGSFLMTGHTSIHPQRWLLAPVLAVHLSIVEFWFGALLPLYIVSTREPTLVAADIVASFTAIATRLVPVIAVAGLVLAWILLPNLSALNAPYGRLLLGKLLGFVILMGFAAFNKWRFGPALRSGGEAASKSFRRSVLWEFVLMCAVLCVTAAMTAFFSPES